MQVMVMTLMDGIHLITCHTDIKLLYLFAILIQHIPYKIITISNNQM